MDVHSYLADLAARGPQVALRGDDVVVGDAASLTDADRVYIRQHKTEIRAALGADPKVEAPVPTSASVGGSSRAPRPTRPSATTIRVIPSRAAPAERVRVSRGHQAPRDAANGRFKSTSAQPPQLPTSAPEPDVPPPGHSWSGHLLYGNIFDFSQPAEGCPHPDCAHSKDGA